MNTLCQLDKCQGSGGGLPAVLHPQPNGARNGRCQGALHVACVRHLRQRSLGHQAHAITSTHGFKGAEQLGAAKAYFRA